MTEAFLQIVLENLDSLIKKEIGLLWGVEKEMEKLSSTLSTIQAVLEDAEEKQLKERAIKNWLRKLKAAVYELDDILDECSIEASISKKVFLSSLTCFSPDRILFRRKISKKMAAIRERLDEIADERKKFDLLEVVPIRPVEVLESRHTGSIITQAHVYGRNEDKEKVIEYLVKEVSDCDDVSVYPIVGIGGLGKTTLTQLVYNDERVKSHFELRIWVCVSEDFDVRRLVKVIIESATGTTCPTLDLDPMQRHLQGILNGRRYLIVLDDVWNDDMEKWDRLKYTLACGSKGASIIVTTRMKKVASVVGTRPLHKLSGLSEDDCWSLFAERAFEHGREEHPNILAIGKAIVRKCGGVPLAAKALGSMMRYKSGENEWLSVERSEFWNLPQDETSILPSLRLSYSNLPFHLRKCFAYCAVFPKDFLIDKEELVLLWMANGFLSSTQNMELEDVGTAICNELYWRSFFEDVQKDKLGNIKRFKMHDLIHDLAQSVMENECCITEVERSIVNWRQIHHVRLLTDKRQLFTVLEALCEVETLRTLVLQPNLSTRVSATMPKFSSDLSKLCTLRVFGARGCNVMGLSSLIRHLKHLRYLDLSHTRIRRLPNSICSLLSLQTLKLAYCFYLQRLPKNMNCLKNLRHLYLNGCYSLSNMPPKLGDMTCLKTLDLFIVGKSSAGCTLAELQGLNLRGELCIKHLEGVGNVAEAKAANLISKHDLRDLSLSWGSDTELEQQESSEKLLAALEPHPSLEYLSIQCYKGTYFPHWMSDQILSNVVSLKLIMCTNCLQLPPLGQLRSLESLELRRMEHVLYLDHNFYGSGTATVFPLLKELIIIDFPSLKRLSMDDGIQLLPCLSRLSITNCPKLTLPCLPSVKSLRVKVCSEELLDSISNLKSLSELTIEGNQELIFLPHGMLQNLTCLNAIRIERFTKLKVLPTNLTRLQSLKYLFIRSCHELESFPEEGLEGLGCLQHLQLLDCSKFNSLSEGLQHLVGLEKLDLNGCPSLLNFPNGIKHLNSLQHLSISGQPTGIYGSLSRTACELPHLIVMSDIFGEPFPHVGSPQLEVLPHSLQYATALRSLRISCYPNLASLPDWIGNLASLERLKIFDCTKLSSLPSSVQRLSKLENLDIQQCPALSKACQRESGEDWFKIMHVPNVHIHP